MMAIPVLARFGVLVAAIAAATTAILPAQQPAPAPAPVRAAATAPEPARPLRLLFLGHDKEHHPSGKLLPLIAAPLARKGIQFTHVSTPEEALVPSVLAHYDGLVLYANHTDITPAQEQAFVDFVESGKAVIAIHCASFMFTKAPRYIPIIGGQFQRHGTGEFTAEIIAPDHPVMKGLKPFQTWDETYVHTRHNPVDRTVLMERVDAEGREPYTWVRTQGKGRVFYTAYGHDERTWGNPGFLKLIENGITWAVDAKARDAWSRLKMPEVEYIEGFNVPNYEKRDPAPKYQMPMTAADSQKFIQTPGEFRVELFAQEPMISKPISFAFDPRGRLWVIEAEDYPNRVLRGGPGDDRIKILEDTNGDGKADKVTVFADHLNLATSLVFANGGVIVAAAPNMLFLQDTNGDDKADVKKVLSTGWGIQDTHAGPSNLQYAADNHVWGVVGYSGYDGTMNGTPMKFLQGVYRFAPDGSGFELVTNSTNNTWGLGFSETFDVFGSTANNDPSFYVAIPNRFFTAVPELTGGVRTIGGPGYQSMAQFYAAHFLTPYIRQVDVWGGYTAAAGHHLYTARAFPQRYWNRIAFISEPTAHLVGQAVLENQGGGFVTRDGWNLFAGAEEWVSPVLAQVGPDGAVWVADWYAFINQHNPTPPGHSNGPGNAYETSMRDKTRGRIYRVVYRDAPAAKPMRLSAADPAGLVAALKSDNMLWRLHAQRLLVERGKTDVVPQLVALTADTSVDAVGTNGAAFHALWTLQGLGAIASTGSEGGKAAVRALTHPAAGVRKAAAMVLPAGDETTRAILDARLLADPDLHTRLAAILRIAELPPSPAVAKPLYAAAQDPVNFGDRWLSRALYIAAAHNKAAFLTEYQADPARVPIENLPIGLRLGRARPDWRAPAAAVLAADWKPMEVPGSWESRGLPAFDGIVWFTRQIDLPGDWAAGAGRAAQIRFGRVGNVAEVWVNGTSLAAAAVDPTAGRSPQVFEVPDGVLKPGANTVTVRIQNLRGDGGFLATAEAMAVQAGDRKAPLAGTWRYRVERQTNAAALYARPGELAAHVAFAGSTAPVEGTLPPAGATAAQADVTLRLGVIKDQLKFDQPRLTVGAGQLVDIVFANTDVMPHNFLIGAPGSLQAIGAAADALMQTPAGAVQQFVPDLPQILSSTRLIEPGQTVTIQFRAPGQPGDYPYLCTFPGHWRVMNGILTVTAGRASEP